MEGKVLYMTRSERKSMSISRPGSPQQPSIPAATLGTEFVLKVLSEYVSVEVIFQDYIYLLSKKFRYKLIKFALVHQQNFIENPRYRRWVWITLSARSNSPELSYESLILNQSRSPDLVAEVDRDINRTMPSHPLFSLNSDVGSENREKLKSVLLAVASAEPSVGYCQGMNFVAAHLLLNLGMNCSDAFSVFISILRGYHFKYLYSPSVPLLPLRMFTFSRLVRQHVPQVWHHLNSKTFSVEIFANQWIMTLFAYYLDPAVLGPHIWTLFFLQGWKVIYQVGLAILSLLETEICSMDVEEISSFMASSRHASSAHPFAAGPRLKSDLLHAITNFRIKNSDLDSLSNQFLSEKLMLVISQELNADGETQSQASSLSGTAELEEIVSSKCLGFSWLKSPETDEYIFLRIDLSSFSTPNRPHEKLSWTSTRTVDVPVTSLRQMQRTLDLVSQRMNREISNITNQLRDVEKRLMVETKQFNALVVNASRLDDQFKELAAQKTSLTDRIQVAVTGGQLDVRSLLNELSDLEREYDSQKESRTSLFDIISQQETKLGVIGKEKADLILRISSLAVELEETQNDVISRSIHSAIDSFASIS